MYKYYCVYLLSYLTYVNDGVLQAGASRGSGRHWRQLLWNIHVKTVWHRRSAKDDHRDADIHQREM